MTVYSDATIDTNAAYQRIKQFIRKTPLEECKELSRITRSQVYLKMEHWQRTGAFKIRGALNRMLQLSEEEKSHGVITASAGNHGLGVAFASELLEMKARIVLPVSASPTKIKMLNHFGCDIVQAGRDYDESEDVAYRIEKDCDLTFIHAFEDNRIIAGQGTIALEILNELPEADVLLVPVGGGGLISGIGIAAKQIKPEIQIIGVQSEASPAMYRALKANRAIESPIEKTIADGLAGRLVSPNILSTIQHYVDDMLLVTENDIVKAILFLLENSRTLVEGAAAVGVAALLSDKISVEGKKCVVLLTGRNIDTETIRDILNNVYFKKRPKP
ncbi:pyridoxal-phosphate dependent enzyme [candidate division KSB1 bacterium]|nr:pyridoxal-phosphate dependent enzyme [candidate division KSB1 bacterium]MBL7094799.1 pyridoxal-phosphate dependent enzyme [candidate division KSB1 bacterium]